MRMSHAALGASALAMLLAFPAASFADSYSVSGPAAGSDVVPSTVVQKNVKKERVSIDQSAFNKNPDVIGTPLAAGGPGVSAAMGTQGGPAMHAPAQTPS